MSKRKVVKLKTEFVLALIKKQFRSYTAFCEKMDRANNWVTDWNRKDKNENPKPKNLPSPEEAAQMCVLLQCFPEDILAAEEDITLVSRLLEDQQKKPVPMDGDELGEFAELFSRLSPELRAREIAYLKSLVDAQDK